MEQTKLRKWIGREVIEQSDGLRRRKGLRNQAYIDDYERATRRQQHQHTEAGSRGEGKDETAPAGIEPGHRRPSPIIPGKIVAPLWMEKALDREREEKRKAKEEEHAESESEEAEPDAE